VGWDWVHLVCLQLTCLLYQPPMIDDEYEAVGGTRIGRGNRNTRKKPTTAPHYPPQIPHRTRDAEVGSQRLTAWAMASSATLSTTNPTSNPGRRCRKPATNRLSYDVVWIAWEVTYCCCPEGWNQEGRLSVKLHVPDIDLCRVCMGVWEREAITTKIQNSVSGWCARSTTQDWRRS
jgi:hypothetical protein